MADTVHCSDHVKQADQSWGAPTGDSEWNDEKAGEEIAKTEEAAEGWGTEAPAASAPVATGGWNPEAEGITSNENDAADTTADVAAPAGDAQPAAEPEPEDNSRSYADYLAEQAEKKLKLGSAPLQARKPNEGSKQDKKWAQAKPLSKEEEEDFIAGKAEKAKREKQRKEKNTLDVDFRYAEPARGGERGRGRGRGGDRGRGGRGRGEFRGEFRGRGDSFRGGAGGAGGRGGRDGGSVNVSDENAFPSLGGP